MKSLWEKIKLKTREILPEHSYRIWIDPVEFLGYENNVISLSSPNAYFIKRLKENYLSVFQKELSKTGYDDIKIQFRIEPGRKGLSDFFKEKKKDLKQIDLPGLGFRFKNGRMLKKGFTFDDFVVGDNSSFAYSASLSLAQGKIKGSNILYLLAKTGLGKSHLSQAIGHHIITKGVSQRVYYVTAEDFTNEMIFSLKNKNIEEFKRRYRKKCDLLILEDIHFLAGKTAIQKELAITLDYLLEADRRIIFSGCDLLDDIPKMNDQLKSRLSLGLVTEIGPPDYDTRVRILKKKSTSFGYVVPDNVIEYIAQERYGDVRQLESCLFGIVTKGQLTGFDIDIDLAKDVLANITKIEKRITIDLIKKLICREFSISEKEIVSSSRKRRIVKPRQIAIFLARKYTDQPIKKIGKSFNKYHATAIYSINAIEKEIKQKGVLFEQLQYLSKKIEAGKFLNETA